MDDELLFETVDPRGYRVVLSAERYYGHIISSDGGHNPHPEFSPEPLPLPEVFPKMYDTGPDLALLSRPG